MFLEDLDSLLTSGNIPDLFDSDELDSLFMDLKSDAIMEGISDDKNDLYQYLSNVSILFTLSIFLSLRPSLSLT